MPKRLIRPRVALMIDLSTAYRRHLSIFAGVHEYAQQHDWELTIDEFADDTLPARRTKEAPYDGVIARATKKLADRAERHGVPAVNVWQNSPVKDRLPGVFPDMEEVGRLRAEHLLSRGLSRFAALVSNTVGQKLDTQGFQAVLNEAGYDCEITRVPLSPSSTLTQWRKTQQIIEAAIARWTTPIGVYVGTQEPARLVAQICRRLGLRIPDDVAIISGYNEPALCEKPEPSLTSVELGGERVGFEAAKLLANLMNGKTPPQQPLRLAPQGLVVRASTDFYCVEDEIVAAALAFIAANSHRPIGANDVARAVSMQTRTLQRRFRQVLDRPVATEIRRVRIERAKRELAQTQRRLSDIARDVGFGESMRMYEVFRRELGLTPSEYRLQRQMAKPERAK